MKSIINDNTDNIVLRDQIGVYLCSPTRYIRRFVVNPSKPISIFRKVITDKDTVFVFNGCVLNENNTFNYYGLDDESTIVILDNNAKNIANNKWISLSEHKNSFNERVKTFLDPKFRSEILRIRDMKFSRLDIQPRKYRKLSAFISAETMSVPEETQRQISSTTIPLKLDEPSFAPLPFSWKEMDYQ